jgi:predicted lactoylglutathione lyase
MELTFANMQLSIVRVKHFSDEINLLRLSISRVPVRLRVQPPFQGTNMYKQFFVSLPVKDFEKSKAFFAALGFKFDPKFGGENGGGMVISEGSVYAMLVTHEMFNTLTSKAIINAHESTEALLCLGCETPQEVDELVAKAVAAGGKAPNPPEDYGFMYSHGFEDLDGHSWGLACFKGAACGS